MLASLGGVWRRVAELAALDRSLRAVSRDERDGIKSQLEELARVSASVRRRHRRVAGEVAGGRRSPRAARAAEAEVRAHAGECLVRREALARGTVRSRPWRRAHRGTRSRMRGAKAAYVAAARRCRPSGAAWQSRSARHMENMAGELAMEQTRFEVRFADELRNRTGRRVASIGPSFSCRRILARIFVR